MDIPQETQESISKLQMIEQNVQSLLMQKQQFQAQMFEIDSALKELEKTNESYKIVGNVMIKTEKAPLQEELGKKKEILDLRLKNIDKQEKQLKDKAETLQKEVMSKMKKWFLMDQLTMAIAAIRELEQDNQTPKNVKAKLVSTIQVLEKEGENNLKASRALQALELLTEDNNMQSYTRTQLFNIVSILEVV